MKFIICALLSALNFSPVFSSIAHASKTKVIWIDEPESEKLSDQELRQKVLRLERAVAQLQRRIFELEYADIGKGESPRKNPTSFTCYIETPFEGLFSVTKASKTEAKAAVAAECSQKTKNSLHCKIENATCGE